VKTLTALLNQRNARPAQTKTSQDTIADAILAATMAITNAASNLVKNATLTQKELVEKGKASTATDFYNKNRTWSEGLISAAKAVAMATAELVNQANKAAQGQVQEEGLVAASKAVSAATTQLVVASRVRSDPDSITHKNLEEAAGAVSSATQALVAAAKALSQREVEPEPLYNPSAAGSAGGKIKEMEQNMLILRLEKDLENARAKLSRMHQAQYKK